MRVPLIILIPIVTTGALIAKNTELATKTAREKNPVLMKILQTVETATSDERLFDVSLKLLKSLCVCMRETLKVKQMDINGFGGDTNALQVENVEGDSNKRVLELYQNIYNKTCFDLRDDLVGKVKAKTFNDDNGDFMDPNCDKKSIDENKGQYQISTTLLPEIKNDYVQLKEIMFKTFIEMRDNHKFFIKRYNLFSTPSKFSLDRSKHSIIVLLTLNSVDEIYKIKNSTEIKSDELDTILKSKSRVDIDLIDARYGSKENNSFESLIPKAASNCTLKSIYTFVLQNAIKKNIKVFKLLRKKKSIKIYIDIPTEIHHVDFSRICCDDDTKLYYCKIDISKKIDSQKVTTPQPKVKKRKKTGNYKDTISKIKTLVKLYDKKIKNSKLDTLHMEPQNLIHTDFIHVITEPDNNLKLTEENYHNSAVMPTDYNINHSTLRNVVNTVKELHKTIKVPDKSSLTAEKYLNDEIMYHTADGMKNVNKYENTLAPDKNIKTVLDIGKILNKKPFNQKQTEINTTSSTTTTNSRNTEDYTYAKLLDTVPDISRNDYKVSDKVNFLNTVIHRPRSTKNTYDEPISTQNVERQNEKYTTHFNQISQQLDGNSYLQELNTTYVNIVNETPSVKPMGVNYFEPNTLLTTNFFATAENFKTVRISTSNQHNTEHYTNTQYLNTKPIIMRNKFTLSDVVNDSSNTMNSTSKYIDPLDVPVSTPEMENQNDKYTLYSNHNPQPIDSYLRVLNTTDINNVSETQSVIFTEENNIKLISSTYPTKNYKENVIEKITTLPTAFIRQNNLKLPVKTSGNNNYTTDIPIQITNTDLHSDYFITSKSTSKEANQSRGSVEKPEISKSVIPTTSSNYLEQSMTMEQSENHFQQNGHSLTTVTYIRNKLSDPATQINPLTNNIVGENIIHTLRNHQTSSMPSAITNAITFKTVREKRTKDNGINFKTTILSEISHKEDKNNKNLELLKNLKTGKNDKHYYVTGSAFIESPYEVDSFTNANNDHTKKDIIKPNQSLKQSEHVFEYKTISMTKTNMLNEHYSKKMSVSPNTTTTTKAINNDNTLTTILLPFNYDFNSKSHTLTESFKPRVLDVSSQNKDVINQNIQKVTTTNKKEYSGYHDILTLFKKDNDFQQYHETINNSEKNIPSYGILDTRTVRGITDNFLFQMNIPTKSVDTFTNNKNDFVTENYGSKQVTDLYLTGHEQVNTNYVSFLKNDNISNSMISPTKTTATFEQSTNIAGERENSRAFTTTESYTINAHESYTTKTKNTEVKKDYHKDQSTKNPSFNCSTLNSRTNLMKATTENDHNNTVERVIKGSVTEVLYSKNRNLFRYLETAQDILSKNMLKKSTEVASTYQVERNNTGDDMIVKKVGKTNSHYITTDTDIDIKYQIDNSSTTLGLNNSDLSSKPKVNPKYKKLQLREYKQSDTRLPESVTKGSVTTELGSQNQPPSTLLDYSSIIKEQPFNTKMTKYTNEVTLSYQVEHNDIDNTVVKKNYSHHLSNAQESSTTKTTNTDIEKYFQYGKSLSTLSVNERSTSEFTKAMTTSDSMKYKMFKTRDSEQSSIKENVTKDSAKLSSKNQTTSHRYSSTTRNQHFNKSIQKDANEDALSNHVGHSNIGSMISSEFGSTKSHHLSGELIRISLIPMTDNSKATKITEVLPLRENINTESRQNLESTHNIAAFTDDIVTNNNLIGKTSLKFIPLKEPIKMKETKISKNMEKSHSHYIPKVNKVHPKNITSLLTHENYNENIEQHTNLENIFLELKSLIIEDPNVIKESLTQFDNYENSTVNFINKKPSESEKHLNLNKDINSSPSNDGRSHSIDMKIMESGIVLTNFTSNTESYYNSITNTDYVSTSKMGIQINNQRPINSENKENAVIEKEGNIEQNFIITTSKLPSKLDEVVSELKSMISVEPISINEIEPFIIVENENVTFDLNEINPELDTALLTPEIYNFTQNSDGKLSPTIVTIEPKSVIGTGAFIERPSSKPELYQVTKKVVAKTNKIVYFEEDRRDINSTTKSFETPDDLKVLKMLNRIKSSFYDNRGDTNITDDRFKQEGTVIYSTKNIPNPPDDHDDLNDTQSDNIEDYMTVIPSSTNTPSTPDDLKVLQMFNTSNSYFHDDQVDTPSTDNLKENMPVFPSITNSPNAQDDLMVSQMLNRIKTSFHDDLIDSQNSENLEENMKVIPSFTNSPSTPDDFRGLQMLETIKCSFRDDRGVSQSTNHFKEDITVIPIKETSPSTPDDLKVLPRLNTNKSSFRDDRADFHSTDNFKGKKTVLPDTSNIPNMQDDFNSFRDARDDASSTDHFNEDLSVIPSITSSPNTPDDLRVLQMLNRIKTSFHDDLNDTKSREHLEEDMTVIPSSTNSLSTPDDLKVVQMLKTIKSSIGDNSAGFYSADHLKEHTTVIPNKINTPNMQADKVWQMMNQINKTVLDDRTDFDTTESNLLTDNTSLALYKFTKPQNNTVLIDEKLQRLNKSIDNKDYDSKFDLTQTTTLSGNFVLGQHTRIHSESPETSNRIVENTETYKESLKLDSNILSNILKEESKSTLKSYSADVATQFGQIEVTTISPIEVIIHHPSTINIYLKNTELLKTRGRDKITDNSVEQSSNSKARAKIDSNVNSKNLSIFTTETLPNILKAEDNYDTTEIPQKYTDYSTQVIAMNNSPFQSNININNESTNNIFEATISELDKTLKSNNIYNAVNTYRTLPYRSNDNSVSRQQPNLIENNEVQSLGSKMKFLTKLNTGSTPLLQIVTNEDKNENTQPTKQLIKHSARSTEPINELQNSTDNIINGFLKEDVVVPISYTKPEITEAFQSKPSSLYISDLSPLYVQNNLQNPQHMNDGMIKNTAALNVQSNANCTETPMNFENDLMTQKFVKNLTLIIIGNINNKETPSKHHVLSREVTKVLGENVHSRYTKISKGTNGANNQKKLFIQANLPSTNSRIMKTDNIIFDEESNSRDETNEFFSTTSALDVRDNFEETFDLRSKSPIIDLKNMNDSNLSMKKNEIESKIKDTSHINKWSSVKVNDKIEILNNNSSLLNNSIITTLDKNTNLVKIGTVTIVDENGGMDFSNITPKISSIYEINDTFKGFFPTELNFTISGTEDFSKNKSNTNSRPNEYIEQSKTEFKNVTYNKDNNSSASDITTESLVTIFENKLSPEHDMDLQYKKIALNSEKSNLTIDRTTSLEYNKITTIKQNVTSLETNNHFDTMNNNLLATGTDIVTKLNDGTLIVTSSSTENVLNEFNEQVELNKTFSPLNILNQFLTKSDQNADTNTTMPKSEATTTINKSIDFASKLGTLNIDTELKSNHKYSNNMSITVFDKNIPNLTDILTTKGTSDLNINSFLPVYVENINSTLYMVPKQTTNVNYYSKFIDSTVRSEIRSSSEMKNMTNDYTFLTNDPANKVYKDATQVNNSVLPDGNTPYQFTYNTKVTEISEDILPPNHTEIYVVKDIDLSTLVLPENEVLIQNHNQKPSLHSQQSTANYSTTEFYSNAPSKKSINENFIITTKEYNNHFNNTLNFTTKDTKNIDPSSPSLTPNEITNKFKHKTEYDKTKTIQEATDTAKAVKTEVYKDLFVDKNNMGTAKDTSTKISYENYFDVTMLSEFNLSNELISDLSGTDQEYSNVHDNKTSRTDLLDTTKESTATEIGLRDADSHIEFEQLTTSTNNVILYVTPVMKRNDDEKIFSTTKTEDPEKSHVENVAWQVIKGIGAQLNTPAISDGFIPEFTTEIINDTDNMKKEASFSKDTIFTKLDSETYENYNKGTSTETRISKIKTVIHDLVTRSNIDEPFGLTNDSTSKDYTNINITFNANSTLSTELTIKDSNFTTTHFEIVSDIRTSMDTSLPFSEHKLSTGNKSNTNITEITSKNEHKAINDSYMKSTSPMSNENNANTVMLTQTEQRINTVLLEATNSGKKIKTTLDDIHYGNKDTTNDMHADVYNEHNKALDHTLGNLIPNESYSLQKPKKIIVLQMEETENTERIMDRHLKTGLNKNENTFFSETIIDNSLVTQTIINEINNQHFENNEPKQNMSNSQSFFVEHKFTNINDTFLNVTDLTDQNYNVNTSYQLNQALSTIISNNDTIFNVYPIPALSTYNNPINLNDSIGNQQYNIDQHTIIQGNYENTTEHRINKNDYTTTRSAPFLDNYNKNTKNEYVIRVKKIKRPESIKTTISYQTINKVNPDISYISLLDNNIGTKNIPANQQTSTKALSDAIIQTEHLIPTSITITSTEKMNPVVKYLKDSESEVSKLNDLKNHRLKKLKQSVNFKTTKNISNVRGERQNQGTFVKVCVNKDKCNTTTKISKIQNENKLKHRVYHSSGNSKNKKQIFNHSKLIKKSKFKGVDKEITHRNISITTNISLIHTYTNNVKKLKGKTHFKKTDRQTVNNIDKMSSRRQVSKLNMSNLFQSKEVHVTTYPLTKTTKEIVYNTYRPTTEEEIDPPTLDKILSTLPILTKNSKKERHEFKYNMKHVIHNNKVKNEIQIQPKIQNNGANEDKLSNSGEKTRLYPVNKHQKPQKTVMKNIKVENRKSDIIQMNTEDFFSRRRAIERGDKLYNILRLHPKSEKIHQVTKLPKQVILRPIFKTIKSYKNTILNVKPVIFQETDHDFYRDMQPRSPLKQDKPQPSIGFRDPVLEKPYYMPAKARPTFLRDKVDAIRSFIYNSELSTPRKHFLNPPSNFIRDYADPLIYDSEGNWRDEEVETSSPSPMTRPKKTIFFLSPTVPYNRYF